MRAQHWWDGREKKWERERERSTRFSNTNYRLPNRPLTRRLVDSPFAISATRDIRAHGYVPVLVVRERGNSIHGHARLSNLDPFQRIARLARPQLSFSSLSVSLWGETRRSLRGTSRSRPREFTGGHSSVRQLFSRLEDWLLSLAPSTSWPLTFLSSFLSRTTNFFPVRPLTVDWQTSSNGPFSISTSTDSQSNYEQSHNEILSRHLERRAKINPTDIRENIETQFSFPYNLSLCFLIKNIIYIK